MFTLAQSIFFGHQSQSPLCDLCDLCAMLSPFTCFSPGSSARSPETLRHQSQSPLRDLCAMLYSRGSPTYGVVAANSFPPCEPWTFTV